MSRLWSRLGARTAAVALLSVGVAGGFYLGEDRETQQQGLTAQVGLEVDRADLAYQRERQAAHRVKFAKQRAAEYEAKLRAAQAAKEAAERARKAKAAAASRKAERAAAERAAAEKPKPYDGPIPASCAEYSGNRKTGCAMMIDAGFGISEFPCLEKLWTKESGWNHKASNSSSGAYGIPQALPGSKMGSVADDWRTNPATQIKWGLGYIKGRYDTPCGAWGYFQSNGHY
ncbi:MULTISPECIES: lytic transglycosylase domain-containing protein [unclassified Micromonospora]|uniref:aggregation-promoting factor C-terminal-like domain-containing protein n=1 Tax=unclassified Micromonospora TaxID=2617518 RepID=UPI000EF4A680|nr:MULTISPECIES: lytic transglycosylase domain-containing protein [unclassified Micromonospora]RLP87330.1 lytic transglycosylase domain-containing protein [Micromonospora sp. BL4]RLP95358.1 lytic transglycosylase domain-containing protein [Micromonospora sp. CV4]